MNAGTAGYLSGRPPTGRPFCELLPAIGSRELRFLRQTSKASRVQACGDLPHKTSERVLIFAPSRWSMFRNLRLRASEIFPGLALKKPSLITLSDRAGLLQSLAHAGIEVPSRLSCP